MLIGVASGLLIIVQAVLLAHGIAGVVLHGAVRSPAWPGGWRAVVVGRALLVWAQEVVAQRAAAAVKSTLRRQVLEHSLKLGPVWLSGERSSALTTLLTKGLDDLDPYFARYLPQLVLAATVPAGVIGWMATGDLIAAGTVLVTLPLIPIFMALIGWATQAHSRRRQHALAVLAHHFADVVGRTAHAEAVRPREGPGGRRTTGDRQAPGGVDGRACGWRSCRRSRWSCWPASRWRWSRSVSASGWSTASSGSRRR